ncbi:MAG: glycosyltransferase family 9 protein [Candidatus Omnitrophica bacterium]|nr:glycosyltransferase family 9 protein [Candidatus Omnitrophota bacterium]
MGREKLPEKRMSGIRKILFVRTDRIGDLLMNLPAIRLLRQAHPKAWLTLMADESVSDLLKNHPDLDEVMTVSSARIKRDLFYRWALARRLKKAGFDLAVFSNPDKHLHSLGFWAAIPERIGYDRKRAFFLTRRLKFRESVPPPHEIEKNLSLAAFACGGSWDGRIFLTADEFVKRHVDERLSRDLPEGDVVVIHPGTTNPRKRWDAGRFAELGDRVNAGGWPGLLLIGGHEEMTSAHAVTQKSRVKYVNWAGALSLGDLIALFQHPRVKILISADSGPVHVAWISGTPVVALYAQDVEGCDPGRWGPRDGKSAVIHKPIQSIPAQEVYECFLRVMEKCGHEKISHH